jgi:hypothetical protein
LNAQAGATSGIVLTFADITATITTQRTLQEERDRAQRYLEVASTLVVVLDARGRVELINRQGCELLGFEEHELLDRDWFDAVVPAADRLDARRAFARLVSGVELRATASRPSSAPAAATTARSPGATPRCATRTATSSRSCAPARTSPSAAAPRPRWRISPTTTR